MTRGTRSGSERAPYVISAWKLHDDVLADKLGENDNVQRSCKRMEIDVFEKTYRSPFFFVATRVLPPANEW